MDNSTYVLRPSETQTVRFRIHHRGRLVQHPVKLYVGGIASEMNWDWDVDLMSYMEIENMIKNEGYCNIRCLWYWHSKYAFSRGLRPLNDDKDVLNFMEDIRGYKLIDIYVEHKVEEVNIEDVRFNDAIDEEVNVEEANVEEVNIEEVIVEDENVEEANGEDENVEDVNVEGVNSEDSETYPDYEECEDDEDDELHTPLGSDVEDKMQIKDAVKDYAMESNKNVVIKKNDKKRVVVKCMAVTGAVGKDGNNKMIPIAYAVVEAETKDSWQLFLKLLLEDLQSIQQNAYGFTSDQQKLHFCSDMQLCSGNILWKFVLMQLCNSINVYPARIKHYITVRISTQKEKLSRYKGAISPNIQQILEKTMREAERWTATWHSDDDFSIFGVSNSDETYIVNLLQKTCACRKWDLTRIPCCHAITYIWFNKKEPEDYVSSFYRKSTVMATYSHIIMPTNGPQLWPTNVTQPINPLVMRRSIGRPKKNRIKANDEPRNRKTLPRSLQTVKCKKCGNFGHNKRTCKGKRAAKRAIPKGGNKKEKNGNNGAEKTVIDGGSQAPTPTQE
ncbi:uncharacterized protein LOC131632657 [Vicia villosa]|uniref:uncharacterized protein LOC131632657 n=1 Tax=Vicia villosa TaxID=3911 RepID=UPI00273C10FC|nr:uncharacterized protein LOC131632657 [Vicia villosa]